MQIDIDHVLFWMDAIRNSNDPVRTLESFWKGQIKSKQWLISALENQVDQPVSIDIYGGWNGVLASMLFQSSIHATHIRSIDIDPACEAIATTMNKLEHIQGMFTALTADMCATVSHADVVINTSCEHVTQDQYDLWLTQISNSQLIVLQSNNFQIQEHVRIAHSLDEFISTCGIRVIHADTLHLPQYDRYMVIGQAI
jgi:hypothetical protein